MAKSFLTATLRAVKAAEREAARRNKAAHRAYNAEIREREREAKAQERKIKQAEIADERDRKAYEKALKAARVASKLAEVDCKNAQIDDVFAELEGLLQATIDVDDFVDLELLRKPMETPFDRPELEIPLIPPVIPSFAAEPVYIEPPKPTGFFGKKKKLEKARALAKQQFESAKSSWAQKVEELQSKYDSDTTAFEQAERKRIEELAREKRRFLKEIEEHNQSVDQFITNLSYGDANAVQDYISMVVENSNYPDHFNVTHEFSFEPETAELRMKVSLPPPSSFPSVKAYKYAKAADEIKATPLSKTELKNRYCSTVYQVSVRSIHEVFEADRRSLIKTISMEVGTNDRDPATGKNAFLPFVGVSAEKESFMDFDLANVVPLATLKHLGAAISKDPVNLVVVDVLGVRKS